MLDEKVVRRRFANSGNSLPAPVQELECAGAERLAEHLQPIRIAPQLVVDFGSGFGVWAKKLEETYPKAVVVRTDMENLPAAPRSTASRTLSGRISGLPWLKGSSRPRSVYMDACMPAVRSATADLVTANLLLHWVPAYPRLLESAAYILRPGGLIMLSALGADTLAELSHAWAQVDAKHAHVNPFPDMHDIGDQLVRAGFTDVVMDASRLTLTYESPHALLTDLRSLGPGANAHVNRRRGLTTPRELAAFYDAYWETPGARDPETGRVRATVELVFAHAWVANTTQSVEVLPPHLPGC